MALPCESLTEGHFKRRNCLWKHGHTFLTYFLFSTQGTIVYSVQMFTTCYKARCCCDSIQTTFKVSSPGENFHTQHYFPTYVGLIRRVNFMWWKMSGSRPLGMNNGTCEKNALMFTQQALFYSSDDILAPFAFSFSFHIFPILYLNMQNYGFITRALFASLHGKMQNIAFWFRWQKNKMHESWRIARISNNFCSFAIPLNVVLAGSGWHPPSINTPSHVFQWQHPCTKDAQIPNYFADGCSLRPQVTRWAVPWIQQMFTSALNWLPVCHFFIVSSSVICNFPQNGTILDKHKRKN